MNDIDWVATRTMLGHLIRIDGRLWIAVYVHQNGDVTAYQDDNYHPDCGPVPWARQHKRFGGSVLAEDCQEKWDRDW